ncbi:MAG: flagellar hook-length control protein FliK [Betaproteobacteria bacterium]|nr:flagellar hook-length control protein FliK [Betaproteobacteria bacterium]
MQANLVTTYLQMLGSGGLSQRADVPRAAQAFPQFSPGAALSALIVSQLGPGLYLADVDGQRVQLNIPAPVTPGEQVSLRLLRPGPVPVFDLIRAEPAPQKTQTSFSGAAQLIRLVLADSLPAAKPLASAPLVGISADAEELAGVLRAVMAHCGVFYESHLRAWAAGKRPLAELLREPQADWSAPASEGTNSDETRGLPQAMIVPDEAKAILRRQLDALELNRVAWRGALWPEQNAEIVITEDTPYREAPAAEAIWRAKVSLRLPHLGDVRAELSLRESSLSVAIGCGDERSSERISADLPQLRARLDAAGFAHNDLRVSLHAAC